jgi:DNA mismatch endonuclease (patch repair protein)
MRSRNTPTPSFKGLSPASRASSDAKRANRATHTIHELLLFEAVRTLPYRHKTHVVGLPGKPDLVFPSRRLAVFCDGDFWHGRDWPRLRKSLRKRANAHYWVAKIASNRARDTRVRASLRRLRWHVVRLWETDIRKDPARAARRIQATLSRLSKGRTAATRPRAHQTTHPRLEGLRS